MNPRVPSLLLVLVVLIVFSSVNLRPVAGTPASNLLSVPYHSQGESLSSSGGDYCCVASVEMVLQYISGKVVSQLTLATELGAYVDSGTYAFQIPNPFLHRGYANVRMQVGSDLDRLKQLNSEGYASIITIWGDLSANKGRHCVVVTGYNETGIIVNDPWPLRWDQPQNRTTGPNAFISNKLFALLWMEDNNLVVVVPYSAYASSSTTAISSIVLLAERNSLKRVGNGWD